MGPATPLCITSLEVGVWFGSASVPLFGLATLLIGTVWPFKFLSFRCVYMFLGTTLARDKIKAIGLDRLCTWSQEGRPRVVSRAPYLSEGLGEAQSWAEGSALATSVRQNL